MEDILGVDGEIRRKGKGGVVILVNVVHAECFDTVTSEDDLLGTIHIAQTDVDEVFRADDPTQWTAFITVCCDIAGFIHVLAGWRCGCRVFVQPAKHTLVLFHRNPSQKSKRHTMYMPAATHFGGIDIGMCIDPYHSDIFIQSLTYSARSSSYSANGN